MDLKPEKSAQNKTEHDDNCSLIPELQKRLKYEKLISRTATYAVKEDNINIFLDKCTDDLGRTLQVSRVNVGLFKDEENIVHTVSEWYQDGQISFKENFQDFALDSFSNAVSVLKAGKPFQYENTSEISDEKVKSLMYMLDIKSVVIIPLFIRQELVGYIGFDECKEYRQWPEDDVAILKAISQIISSYIERKRSEEELKETSQRLSDIASSVHDRFWSLSWPDLRILFASESRHCIAGWTTEEHLENQKLWQEIIHPEDWHLTEKTFAKLLSEGFAERIYRCRCKDGGYTWICDKIRMCFDEKGNPCRIEGVTRDINHIKRVEAERERLKAVLERQIRQDAVGNLAEGMTDIFNNITGIILGYTEIVLEKMQKSDDSYPLLQKIKKAAVNASQMTEQLLSLTRKQVINPESIEINEHIKNMTSLIRDMINKDIELIWKPGENVNKILCDSGHIAKIIGNLCMSIRPGVNAQPDLSPHRILLSTANEIISEEHLENNPDVKKGEYVKISISLEGIHISENDISRIYKSYSIPDIKAGSGFCDNLESLRMASVAGLIHQNGGFIRISSSESSGVRYDIYLPAEIDKAAFEIVHNASDMPDVNEVNVLLVEKDEDLKELLSLMLKRFGYNVMEASSAEEASNIAGNSKSDIHLLLSEINAGEICGHKLANEIAEIHKNMRCLFISGNTGDKPEVDLSVTAVKYLQKPFSVNGLKQKLQEVYDL